MRAWPDARSCSVASLRGHSGCPGSLCVCVSATCTQVCVCVRVSADTAHAQCVRTSCADVVRRCHRRVAHGLARARLRGRCTWPFSDDCTRLAYRRCACMLAVDGTHSWSVEFFSWHSVRTRTHTQTRAHMSTHTDVRCKRACSCRCMLRTLGAHVETGAPSVGLMHLEMQGAGSQVCLPKGHCWMPCKGTLVCLPHVGWGAGETFAGLWPAPPCRGDGRPTPGCCFLGERKWPRGSRWEPAAPGPPRRALAVRVRPGCRHVASTSALFRAGHGAARRCSSCGRGRALCLSSLCRGRDRHGAGQRARRPRAFLLCSSLRTMPAFPVCVAGGGSRAHVHEP